MTDQAEDTPVENVSADQKDPSTVPVYTAERTLFSVPVQAYMLDTGVPVVNAASVGAVLMRTVEILAEARDIAGVNYEIAGFGRWLQSLPATPSTGD